eukprot:CAMPEP_0206504856 /NCGR_PEP_ID=MMETSP0324_2-20121206/55762_1 /ASSEMBLY_ACC=CAM_ASM_000836 /TAXON_ID=2866 /ORGANISM="Crypthecodinium cohnii, Strain Seligo" /LENGTH=121 /DNA_ID=CAMNT_0053994161 /DNA_START=88 /DNA_END=453 /DNA_ORIENTATION=-
MWLPGAKVTPEKVTGTSDSASTPWSTPLTGSRALMQIGMSFNSFTSLRYPCTTRPSQLFLIAKPTRRSPSTAPSSEPATSTTRTLPAPGSESRCLSSAMTAEEATLDLIVDTTPSRLGLPP